MYKTIGSEHTVCSSFKKQFVINYERKTKHYRTINFYYCFFLYQNNSIGFQIVSYVHFLKNKNVNCLMVPTVRHVL